LISRHGQPGQDNTQNRWYKTAGAGQLGEGVWDRTDRIGRSEHGSKDRPKPERTLEITQPGQEKRKDGHNMTAM
jgi:hypothetical protein